jgi:hypothetical protein
LKEKRETISEFVKKKREIFLSKMNRRNKKEETERLEDFINNEEESLKARRFVSSNTLNLVNIIIKKSISKMMWLWSKLSKKKSKKLQTKHKL